MAPQHQTRNGRRLSHRIWFSLLRFRSPLLTEYLLLRVLTMFHFPRVPPHHPIHVQMMVTQHNQVRLPPFGHPRIITLARQLPEAYRRPQRPSSALDAKASTECPIKLNKTQKTVQNKYARNHYTNHKQPTTHNPHPRTNPQAGCAGNHHQQAADAHTVLNVNPTVCLLATTFLCPTQNTHPHPPPTSGGVHAQAQENNTTQPKQPCCLVPHKLGSLERR